MLQELGITKDTVCSQMDELLCGEHHKYFPKVKWISSISPPPLYFGCFPTLLLS